MKALHWISAAVTYITLTNPIAEKLRSSAILATSGAVSGLYFVAYELFRDTVSIMKLHPVLFETITLILMFGMVVLLILKGIGDFYESREEATFTRLLVSLSQLTTSVVSAKLDRFKETGRNLNSRSGVFNKITKPETQINLILNEWTKLLRDIYDLQDDELTATIIHERPHDGRKDHFLFETHKSWLHTKPEKILNQKSLACAARSTGEPIFIADKKLGQEQEKYLISQRDKDKGDGVGSAFCYPVKIVNKDYTDRYMISLITYGKRLCSPYDEARSKAIKAIFCDICRRIELELTLRSIKHWTTITRNTERSTPHSEDSKQGS